MLLVAMAAAAAAAVSTWVRRFNLNQRCTAALTPGMHKALLLLTALYRKRHRKMAGNGTLGAAILP